LANRNCLPYRRGREARNRDDGAHRGVAGAACWKVTAWRYAAEEPGKEIPDFKYEEVKILE
jgi:hypothetical protein